MGGLLRRWITLISVGWLPPCLYSFETRITGRIRPFGTRSGERSKPERVPNGGGGRTVTTLAAMGRKSVWSPPSFPMS